MSWLIWSRLLLAEPTAPWVGYRFGHFENITDPQRSSDNIRRHIALSQSLNVPIEAYLHRGEHQSAWFEANAPQTLEALRDPLVSIAYHPHGIRPFSDLVSALHDRPWEEAVAGFEQLERCAVDYTTAAVNCQQVGGLQAVIDIVGRPVDSVAFSGLSAVSTQVYRHVFGIVVQGDSKSRRVSFVGEDVDVYWYMDSLVISVPARARIAGYAGADAIDALSQRSQDRTHLFSMLATDKVEYSAANRLVDQRYRPNISTFDDVRPQSSEWIPSRKIEQYWTLQEQALRAASDMLTASGGDWVNSADLLSLVRPSAEVLTLADLDQGCAAFDPSLPHVEIPLTDRHISLADLYGGLRTTLLHWNTHRQLPEEVHVGFILGPTGDLRASGERTPPPPTSTAAFLEALASHSTAQIPWALTVDSNQPPLNPVEQLEAMVRLYTSIRQGAPLDLLPRPDQSPWPVPGGIRGGKRTDLSRWDGYTMLQYWTTKRARWRYPPSGQQHAPQ